MIELLMKCLCITCGVQTNHNVLFSSSVPGNGVLVYKGEMQIVECAGCGAKSFRVAATGLMFGISDDGTEYLEAEYFWPPRIILRKFIEAKWLPPKIWQVYMEVHAALQNGIRQLSAFGIRSIVEGICQDKGAPKGTLEKKIDWMESQGIISKGELSALHTQRIFGNEAAHELSVPSEKELGAAMDIVDTILTSIYIVPHRNNLQKNLGDKRRSEKPK